MCNAEGQKRSSKGSNLKKDDMAGLYGSNTKRILQMHVHVSMYVLWTTMIFNLKNKIFNNDRLQRINEGWAICTLLGLKIKNPTMSELQK